MIALRRCILTLVRRYNPAAERIRERGEWLRNVVAEEQNKPLEVPDHVFKDLIKSQKTEDETTSLVTKQRKVQSQGVWKVKTFLHTVFAGTN